MTPLSISIRAQKRIRRKIRIFHVQAWMLRRVKPFLWPVSVLIAMIFTAVLTARILSAIYEPEIAAAYTERDKAVKEMEFWRGALTRIVNGAQPSEITERGK